MGMYVGQTQSRGGTREVGTECEHDEGAAHEGDEGGLSGKEIQDLQYNVGQRPG